MTKTNGISVQKSEHKRCAWCKGCYYLTQVGDHYCCDFFMRTGELRGCPPGEGCKRKITAKRRRAMLAFSKKPPAKTPEQRKEENHKRTDERYRAEYDLPQILALYRAGDGKRAISAKVGKNAETIRNIISFYGWDKEYFEEHTRNWKAKAKKGGTTE